MTEETISVPDGSDPYSISCKRGLDDKVQVAELDNGDIELRSTDFEALQEKKKWYIECGAEKCSYILDKGLVHKCPHHKENGRYKVKDSWGRPRGGYTTEEGFGFDDKIEFTIILKKL